MDSKILISEAAKEVCVESHVLRYWEEELNLPIKRNELGHRYYTREDVERFKEIKNLKERGLQLKAIKMVLKDGKLDIVREERKDDLSIEILDSKEVEVVKEETKKEEIEDKDERSLREEKLRKLRWLMKQMMKETLEENNRLLIKEVRESVIKELDYQFRMQEEREEERDRAIIERNDSYYRKMDELLRSKSKIKRAEKREAREKKRQEKKASREATHFLKRTGANAQNHA